MNEILVDYFLRELKGKNISESIKYLQEVKKLLLFPEDSKKVEINITWEEYLRSIKEENERREFYYFCSMQSTIDKQTKVAWDFHDIAEKGNSYTIGKACRQMAEEQQDREAAYEWVYYKNLLPVKSYPVFTKWVTYFWPMYYANYTI